jgi:thiazole/oxazole-forming peptide maturase SagD family component
MRLSSDTFDRDLSAQIRRLAQQTLSPLTGISQSIGVFLGGSREPGFVVCGAELTGMHVVQGREPPSRSMHIGGCGSTAVEAFLPSLAEALERYAQLWAGLLPGRADRFADYREMKAHGPTLAPERLRWFTDAQYATPGFPFQPLTDSDPVTWSHGLSLVSGQRVHAPSQLLFLGYTPRSAELEPWLAPAVTTGTAVHTRPELALRNALLELVQLDCAMGHWYGGARAVQIGIDRRTPRLRRVLLRMLGHADAQARFYLLPNLDLPVFTVGCLLHDEHGTPAAVVGLGSDMRLEEAMYKALSEASGIYQLAKLILLQEQQAHGGTTPDIATDKIYDLDLNVAYYAQQRHAPELLARFAHADVAGASDLGPDPAVDPGPDIAPLVRAFATTGKELLYYDLTTDDLRQVGFCATRVWSPDTVSLSLPSVPVLGHPRLKAYGGPVEQPGVHPYP